jgi:hypothetical protein
MSHIGTDFLQSGHGAFVSAIHSALEIVGVSIGALLSQNKDFISQSNQGGKIVEGDTWASLLE